MSRGGVSVGPTSASDGPTSASVGPTSASASLARPRVSPTRVGALLVVLAAVTAGSVGRLVLRPAVARAGDHQISIMMDDDRLLYRSDATRMKTLTTMRQLGVEYVRVTVLWKAVAGPARSTPARRRRFRADQPNTYPRGTWDRYDLLVEEAASLGIGVYFDVTGPGPPWAHRPPPASQRRSRATWKPREDEFYKYVAAVGRRYSGTFRDRAGRTIPRVSTWSLWNEPNQGGWLTPQWSYDRSVGGVVAQSPILYRKLYLFGRRALQDTGHGGDFIMAGETAPLGSDRRSARSPMRPKQFIRELMCVDDHGQPYRGAAAAARDCSAFTRMGPLRALAWAHHPYTKKVGPTVRDPNRDSLTMANLGELPDLLDGLATSTGQLPRGLLVISSEFGYETNPPDPFNGMPLARQAEYINVGDFLTYLNPRVAGQTQFQLVDAAPLRQYPRNSKRYWFTYQAGLLFLGGRPKPSLATYAMPFFAYPEGTDPATGKLRVGVWGQLRFHDHGVAPQAGDRAQIEFRPPGATAWQPIGTPVAVTNSEAFFTAQVALPGPGEVRADWVGPAPPYQALSRAVAVSG